MRTKLLITLTAVALVALLVGCESDSTTPDDELPAITNEDAATQSGFMAAAMVDVLPLIWNPNQSKADGEYTTVWTTGPVIGTVYSEFRETDENGDLVVYDLADWGRIYTTDDLTLNFSDVSWFLGFAVLADINQATDTAVIDGGGTLTVGDYIAEFTLVGVVVEDGEDYPTAGIMSFTNEGVTATVTYNGTNLVTVASGDESWTLNLDTGEIVVPT